MKINKHPLLNKSIFVYGQEVKVVNIEEFDNDNIFLHLEEPIVVPDWRYTTDIINLNEYIK